MRHRRQPIALDSLPDPRGRVDALLYGASKVLVAKAEQHFGLEGLWVGLAPLIDKEIRANVDSESVIPQEYMGLFQTIGRKIANAS